LLYNPRLKKYGAFTAMPFYEYQCGDCNHRLEVLQKISDERLVYCPECNEASLKKLISAAAFRLKGTGWYETDFKNNDKKKDKAKTGDKSADSGGEKKADQSKSTDKSSAKGSGDGKNSASANAA
jgi:putative FmdB family regulatory protein